MSVSLSFTPVRRLQLAMVAVYVAVEIGDDDAGGAQREFDAALDVLIAQPPADVEDAAARLRCLAQIGETCLEDTWTAGRIYAAMRTVAAGLAPVALGSEQSARHAGAAKIRTDPLHGRAAHAAPEEGCSSAAPHAGGIQGRAPAASESWFSAS